MSSRLVMRAVAAACLLGVFLPAMAKVTYSGSSGVQANIFNSNSVRACTSCHSTTLSGAARNSAPVGYDFNTYAAASASGDIGNTYVQNDYMPYNNAQNAIVPLNSTEKTLLQTWINDGKLNTAAPDVSIGSASSVGKYSATLAASVNDNGADASYVFQYGTTTGYGSTTGTLTTSGTGGGVSSVSISTGISSLACGTTYHYRARGTNAAGTTNGSDNTFTTSACPAVTGTSGFTTRSEKLAFSITVNTTGGVTTYQLIGAPSGMALNSGIIGWTAASTPDSPRTDTIYPFTVRVGDGTTTSDYPMSVTVTAVNDAPTITSSAVTTATEGVAYTYNVTATDVESDTLTYSLTAKPVGMNINASTGQISWTPPQATASYTANVTVQVQDNGSGNLTDTQSFTINVSASNNAPTFTSSSATHLTASEGVAYSYDVDATDVDGTVTFSLPVKPTGMTIDASTGLISWTPPQATSSYTANVSVQASDGVNNVLQSFTINVTAVNNAPTFSSIPVTGAVEHVTYNYTAVASDVEGQGITYGLSVFPAGMTIDGGTGQISWVPPNNGASSVNVTVTASDGTNTVSQPYVITVTAVNDAPSIAVPPAQTATEHAAYSYQVSASDPENDTLAYSLTVKPTGMTISPGGLISWTPPEGVASSVNVTVSVSDGTNSPVTRSFSIAVTLVNDAPSIAVPPAQTATEHAAYSYQVSATDPESNPLSYSLTVKPTGMTISPSGLISWTPPEGVASSVNVTVSVSDGTNTPVTRSFSIAVTLVNDAPSIAVPPAQTATEHAAYSYQVSASDPENDTLTYGLSVKPTGMTISPGGLISWTPPEGVASSVNVTATVNDGSNPTVSRAFTITVTLVNDAPVLTAIPTQSVTTSTFALQPSATDPDNSTGQLTWSFSGQPAGMSIVAGTGRISWTGGGSVTCATQAACTYSVTVTVKDPGLLSDSKRFNFVIVDTDGDTIPDYRDNCVSTANTNQLDTDHDGMGDLCDSDADNDGIPNLVEIANGLNPLDASDAAQDKDHDGLSNLQEYQSCVIATDPTCSNISIDSVAPVVTPAADVDITATAYFTPVTLGATALDVPDGVLTPSIYSIDGHVLTATAPNPLPLRAGTHDVVWQARDGAGNVGSATQHVRITPLLTLGGSAVSGTAGTVYVPVRLNGLSPTYPVTVSYSTGGTAVAGTDYASLSGTLTFNSGETLQTIPVNVLAVTANRLLTLQLQSVTAGAAVLGSSRSFTLDLTTQPVAPTLSLRALQNGEYRQVVYRNDGLVTIEALAADANGGALSFSWDSGSIPSTNLGTSLTMAASDLPAGLQTVRLTVGDNSGLRTTRSLRLLVVDTKPTLSSADTDGDNVANNVEGTVDANGDGVLDFLENAGDESPESILLRLGSGSSSLLLMAVADSGLQLRLGPYALAAQSVQTPQAGIQVFATQVDNGSGAILDPTNTAIGAIYDFEASGLTPVTRVMHVVLPLPIALIDGAQWRELNAAGRWISFSATGGDEIRSAQRVNGQCPAPQSAAYLPGLIAGNDCVQLTITDGGANDGDGLVNGSVSVTAAPTVPTSVATATPPTDSQSGGSFDLYSLVLLALAIMILRRKEQVR